MDTIHTAPKQPQPLSNSSSSLTLNPPQLTVDKSLICPTSIIRWHDVID